MQQPAPTASDHTPSPSISQKAQLRDEVAQERLRQVIRRHKNARCGKVGDDDGRNIPIMLVDSKGCIIPPDQRSKHISQHFSNSLQDDTTPRPEQLELISNFLKTVDRTELGEFDHKISLNELAEAICEGNEGKSPGQNGTPVELFAWLPGSCLPQILDLFNRILETGVLPTAFLQGVILTILKPNKDPACLSSYRPLTLLNSMGKLLERILYRRFKKRFFPDFIYDEQGSFAAGRGNSDQIFILAETIDVTLERDRTLFVAFLDLKGAFDSVWHDGLFFRLNEAGITGKTWRLLQAWYGNMFSSLPAAPEVKQVKLTRGTRQGSILSPLFFLLYINPLIGKLRDSKHGVSTDHGTLACLFVADDIVLLADSHQELQWLLDICSSFAHDWKLTFNPSKSGVQVYGENFNACKDDYVCLLSGKIISWKSDYTYLGIPFCCTTDHFADLALSVRANLAQAAVDDILLSIDERTNDKLILQSYMESAAATLEYGLEALPLRTEQYNRLQAAEESMLKDLECVARPLFNIVQRIEWKRRKLYERLMKAPLHTWRRKFAEA
eukprot:Lithocolla_globosa_v1_NODE_552_length_3760_cov_9.338462.p1 type:complete len:556 gc:universal NODE_552_length_3760_cov_9.338462:1692-25(-)